MAVLVVCGLLVLLPNPNPPNPPVAGAPAAVPLGFVPKEKPPPVVVAAVPVPPKVKPEPRAEIVISELF